MGCLHYGENYRFEFEDRLLAHLRRVILGKFVLQESLAFTWVDYGQQRTIWLHPTMPLQFEFDHKAVPEVNHEWVERLSLLASSPGGLRLVDEHADTSPSDKSAAGDKAAKGDKSAKG